jgi:uncharacterized protein (AIM24 family)
MNVKLVGHDLKCLHVELMHQESFYCEKGALIYYEEGITSDLKVLDKGVGGMLKRKLSGESIFLVELRNMNPNPKKLALAGHSGMLPMNLKTMPGGIIARGGSYVASSDKVDIDFKLNLTSLIGGTGLVMQKLTGYCTVFLDAVGTPHTLELKGGDTIYVDEKSFICMSGHMEGQATPHFSGTNLLGGEGLSMLRITGPGTVYLSSVNVRY